MRLPTLDVPEGWTTATINQSPVALGEWRTFTFGANLRLHPTHDVWAPERVSTNGMKEENVETLMLLNLDVLYPQSFLALGNKSLRDWAGADIEATDPAGCRHLFEVKYGAPAKHVVDQALSYALDTVRGIAEPTPHFHEQSDEDRERFIACRIAGFWTDTRADKWKRDAATAPAQRDWDALAETLNDKPVGTLSVATCREAAAQYLALPKPQGIPATPKQVQFHLAVPDPAKISKEQLFALGRLKWRGHRARIWQVAAEKMDDGIGGRFSIREVWLPPTDTAKSNWSFPLQTDAKPGTGPAALSLDELLASTAAIDPVLFARFPVPSYTRGESAVIGHGWFAHTPSLAIHIERDRVKLQAWVINPKALPAIHGDDEAKRIKNARCRVVSRWLLRAAPPADPTVTQHVENLRRKARHWQTTDPDNGLVLHGHHSSGLAVGEVIIDSTDCAAVAQTLSRCLHHLLEATAPYADAFGPEVIQL